MFQPDEMMTSFNAFKRRCSPSIIVKGKRFFPNDFFSVHNEVSDSFINEPSQISQLAGQNFLSVDALPHFLDD